MSLALETRALNKSFGGLAVTREVDFQLERGARHALIGPNGAGKTTLVNLLSGVLAPTSGSIHINGEDVSTLPTHRRVGRGLVRTFQISALFPQLTARSAVALAICQRRRQSWIERAFRPLAARRDVLEEGDALLASFGLAGLADVPAGRLAYGKQRLLDIVLALALAPKLLLLDEPAAGIPEGESDEVLATLAALPRDVSVLLIEHDMDLVFRFAERITVMVGGAILLEGTPEQIAADSRVRQVYLGKRLQ